MKKTQKDIVIQLLRENGNVSNFWAFNNYILRLASIISNLRKEGWEIETEYEGTVGKKNCKYILIKEPNPVVLSLWPEKQK